MANLPNWRKIDAPTRKELQVRPGFARIPKKDIDPSYKSKADTWTNHIKKTMWHLVDGAEKATNKLVDRAKQHPEVLTAMKNTKDTISRTMKKHKRYIAPAAATGAALLAIGQASQQVATLMDRTQADVLQKHVASEKAVLEKRSLDAYLSDVQQILSTKSLSYPSQHPEVLGNPLYERLIPTTKENPIGPMTLTRNHEAMAQKALLNLRYKKDILKAVKFITKYQSIFQYTAKRADLPWQLFAAIGERENHKYYSLPEDQEAEKHDELAVFRTSASDGGMMRPADLEEQQEIAQEIAPLVDNIQGLSSYQKEELKTLLPHWVQDAQLQVHEATNHRLYKNKVGLSYSTTDMAAMLGYGEVHNGMFNRSQGRTTEYLYSGTLLRYGSIYVPMRGKNIRNDNKTGIGRFSYKPDYFDPQPGVFPVLRTLYKLPKDLSPEAKEKVLSELTSELKKEQ